MFRTGIRTCVAMTALLALAAPAVAGDAPRSRRVAVVAFKNLRPKTDTDWIGSGAAETLTTKLAGVPGLVVVERAQVQRIAEEKGFQESDLVDPQGAARVGKLLGAERVVLGTYAADGDALLFNVRVVDVGTGVVLSAATVAGTRTKVFDTLFQLAEAVVKSFDKTVVVVYKRPALRPAGRADRIVLSDVQKQRLRASDTASPKAYEAYARAAAATNADDKLRLTTRAIGFDPKYTAAYRRRAEAHVAKGQPDKALADCDKAISGKPNDGDTYYTRGLVYLQQHQNGRALRDFTKAIKLMPRHAGSYCFRAMARYRTRQYRQAWENMGAARALGHKIPAAFEAALARALKR